MKKFILFRMGIVGAFLLFFLLFALTADLQTGIVPCLQVPPLAGVHLPGAQQWKDGTSSFLFGANDASWEWSPQTLGNSSAIRATVRGAGITVIRTPLTSGDADKRVAAIEDVGAACLGILRPQDALQVVQSLGARCRLYEWENEPDNAGISPEEYGQSWNRYIPQLRKINPQAIFIGPVVAFANIDYITRFLTVAKASGSLPDAISYHLYPCTDLTPEACPSHIEQFTQSAALVRTASLGVLGRALPLALTEWNYSWKPHQTPNKDPYMRQFTTESLEAMRAGGIVLANQFDLASNAGYGSLDELDTATARAYPQLTATQALIEHYQPGQSSSSGVKRPLCPSH
ncbi:glycosyl hydrolase [Tengunoibacter tsumagoiensis]|uniref:Asl1-like glycosyl hydrolase catalytic domain-containing protein n=1 Tax=Tengunoibacter tsumagoiensis TaxID=2014871 RepID=A0A401ZX38_9CHLR|nr:glycosyl hydrolase [Tengunoibacter tsumagoiensis]GCE11400.1 hypothetical protein KTT_12590 [Tengunoibacter tsumagoiensis]